MDKKFLLFCAALTVFLVGVFVITNSSPTKSSKTQNLIATYSLNDKERPKAEIKSTSQSMGDMKVSDEKYVDFTVKNTGSKNLQITNMKSSCGCTVGKIVYQGRESQEFGMHSQSVGVLEEITPGSQAVIRVIYRPYVMPIYGFVEREVYFDTNDPQNSKITFKVTANVR